MTAWLCDQTHEVNRKRVSRLMELIGIEALYPKPRLSQPGEGHKIYPYLLKDVKVTPYVTQWKSRSCDICGQRIRTSAHTGEWCLRADHGCETYPSTTFENPTFENPPRVPPKLPGNGSFARLSIVFATRGC
jgi:hypothetical protein